MQVVPEPGHSLLLQEMADKKEQPKKGMEYVKISLIGNFILILLKTVHPGLWWIYETIS